MREAITAEKEMVRETGGVGDAWGKQSWRWREKEKDGETELIRVILDVQEEEREDEEREREEEKRTVGRERRLRGLVE